MKMSFEHHARASLSPSWETSVPSFSMQRKCACGTHTTGAGACDACRREHDGALQRSAVNSVHSSDDAHTAHEVSRSPGEPLDSSAPALMAPSFEHDFSRVRVHAAQITEDRHEPQAVQLKREETKLPDEEELLPKDKDKKVEQIAKPASHHESVAHPIQPQGVTTVLRPGYLPQTLRSSTQFPVAQEFPKFSIVAPGGAPGVNNAAANSNCLPGESTLSWDVVPADAGNWGVSVTAMTLNGQVNIFPWPSSPNSMVVPNTPNPVDGGNINNTAGSDNHWQAAIDDMSDYHRPGGGAGPNWHSVAASSAHEWAHWNTDWVTDSIGSAAGGNWSQANADLDALRQPKATSKTKAAATTALRPKVNDRFKTFRNASVVRWNAIPDKGGTAGSTGFDAGMAVLNTLIAAVRAYADSKGWTAAAPPAGGAAPASGLSRGAKVGLGVGGGALAGALVGGAIGGGLGALVGAGIGAVAGLIGGLIF
jgi:hypothetical protein